MGQKVHPTGVRVGIIKDWNAKWYADSKNFADYLVEDQKIRKFLKKKTDYIQLEFQKLKLKEQQNLLKLMFMQLNQEL